MTSSIAYLFGLLSLVYLCGLSAWIHKDNVQCNSVLMWSKIKQFVVLATTFLLIFSVQPSWASTEQSINNYGIGINLLSKTSSKDFSKIQQDLMNVYLKNDEIFDGFDKISVPDEQFNDYLHDLVALNNSREIILSSMTDLENTYNTNFSSKIPSEVDSAIESGVDDIFKRGDEEVSAYWSGFQDRHWSLGGLSNSFVESTQLPIDALQTIKSAFSAMIKIKKLMYPNRMAGLYFVDSGSGVVFLINLKKKDEIYVKLANLTLAFNNAMQSLEDGLNNGGYEEVDENGETTLNALKIHTDVLGVAAALTDLVEILSTDEEFKNLGAFKKIAEDILKFKNSVVNAESYAKLLANKDKYSLAKRDEIFSQMALAHESFAIVSSAMKFFVDVADAFAPDALGSSIAKGSEIIDILNDINDAIQSGFFTLFKSNMLIDHSQIKNKLEIARIYARTFQDVNLFVAKKLGDAVLSYYPTLFTEIDGTYSYDLDKVIYHFTNNIKVVNVNNVELVDLPNEWKSGNFSVSVKFCGDDTNIANLLFRNASSSTTKSMSYALSGAVDLGGGCRKYNISVDGWSIYDHAGGNTDVSLSVSVAETASPIYTKRLVDMNDADNDKLPDSWENDYFKSLSEIYSGDFDADGFSNGYEYWHHTDPTKKGSDGILNYLVLKPTQYHDGTWNYNCSLAGNYWSNVTVDGCNVTVDGNSSIAGRLTMNRGSLILNGKSLSVGGSFLQSGGTLNVNGGKLMVMGDYRIQTPTADGNSYTQSDGILHMADANDYVQVGGAFVMETIGYGYYAVNPHNLLTAGTLEVKGDFTQKKHATNGTYTYPKNFYAQGTHRVLLSGNALQKVSFDSPGRDYSHFNILKITNSSNAGVEFTTRTVVTGQLEATSTPIVQSNNLTLSGTAMITQGDWNYDLRVDNYSGDWVVQQNQVVKKNLYLEDSTFPRPTINLNGKTLTVGGNLIQSGGTLNVNGGKLVVTGDYRIQKQNADKSYTSSAGILYMTNAVDVVQVGGSFVTDSQVEHDDLTAGVLEVKGNFTQQSSNANDSYNPCNFRATGKHKVVLSGTGRQVVSFEDNGDFKCKFAALDIQNTVQYAVSFAPEVPVMDSLNYAGEKLYLESFLFKQGTLVLPKDLTLKMADGKTMEIAGGGLRLNSKTLTVEGNLLHSDGDLDVNGGKLVVTGDYRIQKQNADKSYSNSAGTLRMTNEADLVQVGGSFVTDSHVYHGYLLSAGVLEVKGNFTELSSYDSDAGHNFPAQGSHKVVLSGTGKQVVSFEDSYSQFSNLWLTNNTGVDFTTPITVSVLFEHNRNPFTLANATNSSFVDFDGDGVKDNLDSYPQDSSKSAGLDGDGDGVSDDTDAFPYDPKETVDTDKDGIGNNADTDDDNDSIADDKDAFPLDAAESLDTDKDGISDNGDNCPATANPAQSDKDTDGVGDACDTQDDRDDDADGIPDGADNCPAAANPDQADKDTDGMGDACDTQDDTDSDADGIRDAMDNCPAIANPDQADKDADGIGDACDSTDNTCTLDIDGNGQAKALTDGLLTLRYLFNFRDAALVNKAVATDAQRKTAADISAYLERCKASFDVDGNGQAKALTDGLLILRYQFNFRGNALVNKAVAADATRKTAADIEPYLQRLYPSLP